MTGSNICRGNCYGCSACANACPAKSITMREDEKGFLVPEVDQDTCTDCHLCSKACESAVEKRKSMETYVVKHKDERVHLSSQSGGAFTAISDCILERGGAVYGSALDDKFEAAHIRAADEETRNRMRGSKYIPSVLRDTFTQVKMDLDAGRLVLFAGLPCQVGGLLKYLQMRKQDTSRLYTIDLICHGTPSVLLWRKLMKHYESKYHAKIERVVFRDKSRKGRCGDKNMSSGGVGRPSFHFCIKKKQISDILHRNLFYSNLALRESCYACEYAKEERVADFTIGDAWGVREHDPEFYDSRGVSLLFLHTTKAEELFEQIRDKMHVRKVSFEKYKQGNMEHPSCPHRSVEEFWKDYSSRSFHYIIEKYGKNNVFLNRKYVLKNWKNLFLRWLKKS